MCGIAAIVSVQPSDVSISRLQKMTDAIAHRGPDGEGQWISEDGLCGLGNRRLAIVDLTTAGQQPMHYLDRYSITFNGEIYNHSELKTDLESKGYLFKSNTDTEVLMALYHEYGESLFEKLDGMFAFAIYDQREQKLFVARDRFGEKPLYFHYRQGSCFLLASEMKALWAAGVLKDIDQTMLFNYMAYGFVEDPQDAHSTFYTSCKRLPQAHYLVVDIATCTIIKEKKYWDIDYQLQDDNITVADAAQTLRELFTTSIQRRLQSDVASGSSLSGGLDSSIIACGIADLNQNKIGYQQQTFSARFHDYYKDEGRFIEMVSNKTGAYNHVIYPTAEGLVNDIDKLFYYQEEPFVSSSVYAQYKVMELARSHNITVLLDGQGADEVFAGYHSYYAFYFAQLNKQYPKRYSQEISAYQALHRTNNVNGLLHTNAAYHLRTKLPRFIDPLKSMRLLYQQWKEPFFAKDFFYAYQSQGFRPKRNFESLNEVLYHNTMHHGLHELLRYADRNSMAHGREVRLPYLNHKLVSFCFSLPAHFKIRNGWTKWILRESFGQTLPGEIAWRKDKIAYEPPEEKWLQQKRVKELVDDSTQMLINMRILHKNALNDVNKGKGGQKKSWQKLMAAHLLQQSRL